MNKIAIALLTVAVITSFLYAQIESKPNLSQEYIDILGVTVRLGMTKAEINEKLGAQKLKNPWGQTEDYWFFGEHQPWPSSIEFRDGKVIFASQSWIGADEDVARALFGAASLLNKQGYSTCQLFTDTAAVPSTPTTTERIWLFCGKKSILVQSLHDGKNVYPEVFERLGFPTVAN